MTHLTAPFQPNLRLRFGSVAEGADRRDIAAGVLALSCESNYTGRVWHPAGVPVNVPTGPDAHKFGPKRHLQDAVLLPRRYNGLVALPS